MKTRIQSGAYVVKLQIVRSFGATMRFEQLNEGVWAMTYLIVDETTNEAAWLTRFTISWTTTPRCSKSKA